MNKTLTKLPDWCTENDIPTNTLKTNYQIFALSHIQPNVSAKFNNEIIKKTQNYRYLGVISNKKLTGKNLFDTVTERA
jgi:hypothetical protein